MDTRNESQLEITRNTRVYDIIERYGDIADVMAVFGVKPVARFSIRRIITRVLSVERAARIHHVELDEFLGMLREAVAKVEEGSTT